ncbi:hypothetical protein J0895_11070, partial [Phormidium pseudopriestleyi FRX01]|nr:hypothetical protein [Phormidium pseudopriestleyi FRX01]
MGKTNTSISGERFKASGEGVKGESKQFDSIAVIWKNSKVQRTPSEAIWLKFTPALGLRLHKRIDPLSPLVHTPEEEKRRLHRYKICI